MNEYLTNRQIAFLLFGALVGYGTIGLPKVIAENAGTGGWIVLILSTLLAIIITYIITSLNSYHKNKTIFEYSKLLTGKFIGTFIILIYFLYFFMIFSIEIRIVTEKIKLAILPKTPLWATSLLFCLTTFYITIKRLRVIARICVLYGFIIILSLLLIHFFMFSQGHLINLRPFIGDGNISTYIKALPKVIVPFLGVEALVIVPFHSKNNKKVFKYTILMTAFIGILYILIAESCISVIGVAGIINYEDALIATIRRIDVEFLQFFRRLDGLFLIAWIMSIFCTISIFSYSSVFLLSKFIKNINFNLLAFFTIAVACIVARIPRTMEQVKKIFDYISYLGTIASVVIPTILLIITKVKKYE